MKTYGALWNSWKFITAIKNTHRGMHSRILHKGQFTGPFDITWVGQRRMLSRYLFLLTMDYNQQKKGIQWVKMQQLDDLDFADDIAVLS